MVGIGAQVCLFLNASQRLSMFYLGVYRCMITLEQKKRKEEEEGFENPVTHTHAHASGTTRMMAMRGNEVTQPSPDSCGPVSTAWCIHLYNTLVDSFLTKETKPQQQQHDFDNL